ncbi:MAG: nitrogen fixation protein FixH [Pseudomonadota bacterium]|nr:nitrogen fixation protein FixH [Pseudomonadota bacterium]
MWMVVGGPLIVVVAGFVTLYLAIRTPDPVYTDSRPAPAAAAAPEQPGTAALAPAMQARNHAATGGLARPAQAASAAPPR